MYKLSVGLSKHSYQLLINDGFEEIGNLIKGKYGESTSYFIITDSNVSKLYCDELKTAMNTENVEVFVFEAGEKSKNLSTVNHIFDFLIEKCADRESVLIALGGGVVGDITGFVAGTYMRGLRYIQVPTTLLSQVDSSVGGKTGVDYGMLKNIIGIFKQPDFVYINTSTLLTLDARQYTAGIAEMIVHSLIGGREAFNYLRDNFNDIISRNSSRLPEIIRESCSIKVKIVECDEFEKNIRRHLNLGHTVGHAIESWTGYSILHGEAVAIGIRVIFEFAYRKKLITEEELSTVVELLEKAALPIEFQCKEPEQIIARMKHDKKVKSLVINSVVPRTLGEVFVYPMNKNDEDMIFEILVSLDNSKL